MKKIKIITTLGPSTLKKKVLRKIKTKVDLVRLNMSHLSLSKLKKNLDILKKNNFKNICIDTEGAQIRTHKVINKKYLKKKKIFYLNCPQKKNNINLYPRFKISGIKVKSLIKIGFTGLVLKVIKNDKKNLLTKVVSEGYLENNKGVHFENIIDLDPLTLKDMEAIKIATKYKIRNFALSFANDAKDVVFLRKKIPYKTNIISKIESKKGYLNRKQIIKKSDKILIDRGDLSRYINISKIPIAQKIILEDAKKLQKEVYIATNLLESMIQNNEPTRAESNDIFNSLNDGCKGLVLAAETAVGKYPNECINFLQRCILAFKNKKNIKKNKHLIFS